MTYHGRLLDRPGVLIVLVDKTGVRDTRQAVVILLGRKVKLLRLERLGGRGRRGPDRDSMIVRYGISSLLLALHFTIPEWRNIEMIRARFNPIFAACLRLTPILT